MRRNGVSVGIFGASRASARAPGRLASVRGQLAGVRGAAKADDRAGTVKPLISQGFSAGFGEPRTERPRTDRVKPLISMANLAAGHVIENHMAGAGAPARARLAGCLLRRYPPLPGGGVPPKPHRPASSCCPRTGIFSRRACPCRQAGANRAGSGVDGSGVRDGSRVAGRGKRGAG